MPLFLFFLQPNELLTLIALAHNDVGSASLRYSVVRQSSGASPWRRGNGRYLFFGDLERVSLQCKRFACGLFLLQGGLCGANTSFLRQQVHHSSLTTHGQRSIVTYHGLSILLSCPRHTLLTHIFTYAAHQYSPVAFSACVVVGGATLA